MPRIITSLCLRDSSCVEVCPVDCISPGEPVEEYPTYYIDPDACIDCGACEAECPNSAIFELLEVPVDFEAEGGEILSAPHETKGFTDEYKGEDRNGETVHLLSTRILKPGEIVDLSDAIERNSAFYSEGPGYTTQK
jgi:ferredoxin